MPTAAAVIEKPAESQPAAAAPASPAAANPPAEVKTEAKPAETAKADAKAAGAAETVKVEAKADEKPADEKKAETPAAPVVPEKYELKAPEGVKLDAAQLEAYAAEAKGLGLTQDQAQKLVDRDAKRDAANFAANTTAYEQASAAKIKKLSETSWLAELQADKEVGGEKFTESAETAKRFIAKFGSQKLKDFFNSTGFGNEPELFRAFVKAGKAMKDDVIISPPGPATGARSAAQVLYGETSAQKQ